MNNKISYLRLLAIISLSLTATYLFFATEQDKDLDQFILHVLIDKITAVCLFFITAFLYRSWSKTDKLIAKIDTWCTNN